MLSDIRSFKPTESARSDNTTYRELDNQYRRELASCRALSPEARARRLGFFRLIYWGFTKKQCDGTDIERRAEELQRQFFERNPKRTF
jgi:hypothetical protein